MAPQHDIVLGLVLCLAQLRSGAQQEHRPPPNISVQPSPNVLLGESVTIVCRGPSQATSFRVEKEHKRDGIKETHTRCDSLDLNCGYSYQTSVNCAYVDQSNVSRDGSNKTEAQFRIKVLCEGTVGSYRCRYHYNGQWSVPSKLLDLVVTSKEDFDSNSGRGERVTPTLALSSQPLPCTSSTVLSTRSEQDSASPPKNQDKPDMPWVYIIIGISVTVFVLLLLLLLLLVRLRRRRRELGNTSGKLKKQRPQDRVTAAAEVHTGTPEPLAILPSPAVADGPPLLGVAGSPMTAAAEAPEEVTYAQLNPNSLSHAAPTQPEPGTESCTYASVVRH